MNKVKTWKMLTIKKHIGLGGIAQGENKPASQYALGSIATTSKGKAEEEVKRRRKEKRRKRNRKKA